MPVQEMTQNSRDVAARLARLAWTPRVRTLLVVVTCSLIIAVGLYKQIRPQDFQLKDSDFYSYYNAALALRHGANPFAPVASWMRTYVPGSELRASYYVYAPSFALLIVPSRCLMIGSDTRHPSGRRGGPPDRVRQPSAKKKMTVPCRMTKPVDTDSR